jgi:hypothetical protein
MPQYRFNVFGRLVVIKGAPGNWSAFLLGSDGTRRKADFVVPGSLCENELCGYLSDLFHESASSTQPFVKRLD